MYSPRRSDLLPNLIEEASGEVYHYTSPDGLIGMLKGRAAWASEATSLNDLAEVRYGWKLIGAWIEAQEQSDALDEIRGAAEWFDRRDRDVFVLSASLDGDDANQWRLYGADRRGYAVGLDASTPLTVVALQDSTPEESGKSKNRFGHVLANAVEVSPWFRVLYEPDRVTAVMTELLHSTEKALEDLAEANFGGDPDGPSEAFQNLQDEVYSAVATVAALAKPFGFRGENEARIVATFILGTKHCDYRGSKDGVVPFVRLVRMPDDIGHLRVIEPSEVTSGLPIKSVTLGPRLREENIRATKGLLSRHGCDIGEVSVTRSALPLR